MNKYVLISLFTLGIAVLSCTKDKVNMGGMPPVATDCVDTISFSTDILPVIQNECFSCHSGTSPIIKDYATINNNANFMLSAMRGDGAQLMPQGGPALDPAFIKQFNCWIQQGKQNN